MRLICPNCDAQYEVPAEVMPASGRDVQCSNCGQTWFQHHPDHAPDPDAETPEPDASDEEVAPPPPPPPKPGPERKQLDPSVADILRQEAEAEQAARAASARGEPMESQPELGLDTDAPETEADRRAREARERMARMRGAPETSQKQASAGAAASGARRDLLPDIDEINSSLRAGNERNPGEGSEPQIEAPTRQRQRKRGFRTGFLTVIIIFVVLAAIYVLAPRLASAVPTLETPLRSYVQTVDRGRLWLDSQIRGALQSLDDVAEEDAPTENAPASDVPAETGTTD